MTSNIDQKFDAILEAIKNLETRVSRIEGNGSNGDAIHKVDAPIAGKKLSLKEYLLKSPPTNDIQRTLAVGYFLENYAGVTSFTSSDLEKGYRDAKEDLPSNIRMNISRCIKHGHIMEAEEKKNNKTAYVVTRSGEQFVNSGYKASKGK